MAVRCILIASLVLQPILSQPDIEWRLTQQSSIHTEDPDVLGTSLLNAPSFRDILGASPVNTNPADVLGSSLINSPNLGHHEDPDVLGTSLMNSPSSRDILGTSLVDTLGTSFNQTLNRTGYFNLDEESMNGLLENIRGPRFTSTPSKVQKELTYDRVTAKQKPDKPLSSFLYKEVSSGKKMKAKALNTQNIRNTLKLACLCGRTCMKQVSFRIIKCLRQSYWSQSVPLRNQILKSYVRKSITKGKHRLVRLEDEENKEILVCSKAFLSILRINKNSLTTAIKSCRTDLKSIPGVQPKRIKDNTLTTINWIEDYASFYGDRMPNSKDVLLPYKFMKISVYKSYKMEVDNPVSKTQFFKLWTTYFPHLKIKQTNSFSKCSTCTLLEKHRENALDFETRTMYGRLKDEHHERQHMERRYYYSKRDFSRKCPLQAMSLIIDGMDQLCQPSRFTENSSNWCD